MFVNLRVQVPYRRIERRMGIHQIDRIAGYVRFLQENPQELDLLFKELLRFLDFPSVQQRRAIWKIYLDLFSLDPNQPRPVEADFTGAEMSVGQFRTKMIAPKV